MSKMLKMLTIAIIAAGVISVAAINYSYAHSNALPCQSMVM